MNYKRIWDNFRNQIDNNTNYGTNKLLKIMIKLELQEFFQEARVIHTFNYENAWFMLKKNIISKDKHGRNELIYLFENIEKSINGG